jgi:hypothetical protein
MKVKTLFKLLAVLTIVALLTFTVGGAAMVLAQGDDEADPVLPAPPPVLVDSDGDGVADSLDQCPNTPLGAAVDASGCPVEAPPEAAPEAPPETVPEAGPEAPPEAPPEEPEEAELPPEEVLPVEPAAPPELPVEAPVEADAEPTPVLAPVDIPAEPEVVEAPVEPESVEAAQAYSYVSGITVVNLDSTQSADTVVTFYQQDGTVAHTINDTIAGGSAKTWYIPNVSGMPDPFVGSAVVSANRQIAATINTQTPTATSGTLTDPNRVGTASGVGNPTSSAYVTQVMREYYGWNSYLAVQNAGSSTASVTVYYYDSTGAEVTAARETASIPAYANNIFQQGSNTGLTSGQAFSAYVDGGGQNLAVVCNMYNSGSDYTTAQFLSYNGAGSGAGTVYVPRIVKDYYNYQGGLTIMNVSSTSTNVDIAYNFGGTTYNQTIGPLGQYQGAILYMGPGSTTPAVLSGVSGTGSATVQAVASGATIIATVNEDNRVSPAGRGVTYNAFTMADATTRVAFPQITARYYGYSSGWQIQSLESSNSCTASYSTSGGSSPTGPTIPTLGTGASFDQFAPNATGMGSDYNGSVAVSCSNRVVGIANLSFRSDIDPRYGENYGDSFTTTGGINY